MAANNYPIYPKDVKTAVAEFTDADTNVPKALVTAGANGCRVDSIIGATDEAAAKVFNLYVNDGVGATNYRIGTVSIAAGAGTDANITPSKKVLNPTDIPGLDSSGSLWLGANHILKIGSQATLTNGKKTHFTGSYGDY